MKIPVSKDSLPILIVEDDVECLALLESLLKRKGYSNVVAAGSGEAALEYLAGNEVGALVLDLHLPGVSGTGLVKMVRACRPCMSVVIVTGSSKLDTAVECMKLGAADFLTKPISFERLVECLDRALERYQESCGAAAGGLAWREGEAGAPAIPEELPERLRAAIRYLEENLAAPISLERLAEEACFSKFHFCREFKKYLGVTPIQYLMQRRIDLAARLLRSKHLPISAVALKTGFPDQSEFTKSFKKCLGVTPSTYKQAALRGASAALPGLVL
ncbi:hypothetical protein GMST_18900 [Geomonas silvestris]|uniref:DNA-binding response regulator n=1 Tax=Geomonas silvestris TaxID=2740184 RepID=A0A6V8MHV4_9BACT|nr:AraC family transcriptional regulator [Geomonas silvestris]GFO59565.1 hypothetical protein GMST_18900 [Geomonas silvestris]